MENGCRGLRCVGNFYCLDVESQSNVSINIFNFRILLHNVDRNDDYFNNVHDYMSSCLEFE